jgi:hypothetical protein
MKTVTDQFQRIYNLDDSRKMKEPDGESYPVSGIPGTWVKLVKDTTKAKQLQVEQQITDGGYGDGVPREIVYRKGKFAGYTFEKYEPEPDPVSQYSQETEKKKSSLDMNWVKYPGAAAVCLILSVFQYKVFFNSYLHILNQYCSQDVVLGCKVLGFSGFTGILAGVLLALVCGTKLFGDFELPVFIGVEAAAFMIGLILIEIILVVLAMLFLGVLSLLIKIIPFIFAILLLLLIVKIVFRR